MSKVNKYDKIKFSQEEVLSSDGHQIMMSWEIPIMHRMADEVCKLGGDILEIGFGMGISANRIQNNDIKSHTIIEINQDIYQIALDWSENKNVNIVLDDFLNYLEYTNDKFDGILFDPYPSEIMGLEEDGFLYGKNFFDKIKKLFKENCVIVPFVLSTNYDINYLIDYVPLKSIEVVGVKLDNQIRCQYFTGCESSFFVFNI